MLLPSSILYIFTSLFIAPLPPVESNPCCQEFPNVLLLAVFPLPSSWQVINTYLNSLEIICEPGTLVNRLNFPGIFAKEMDKMVCVQEEILFSVTPLLSIETKLF